MRELKFRAWNHLNKKMFQPTLMEFHPKYIRIFTDVNKHVVVPDEAVLMQYTGLKDRKGVEIYEGDIVAGSMETGFTGDVIGTVVYAGLAFSYRGKQLDDDTDWFYTITSPYFTEDKMVEVIGNIYENPALLEEKYETNKKES